jgi:hypothetical protein
MTPDTQFERELEVFRTEAEAATQFFYAFLTVHAVAADHEPVYKLLNQAPLFWNKCLGALQTAAHITLGRVFDQGSAHNLGKVLRIAQDNLQIFSKEALGRRKQGNNPEPPEWLEESLRDVYVPTPMDFRRIRAQIKKRRTIYDRSYEQLRHKLFAHKEVSDQSGVSELFGKTNIRELQLLLGFLRSLHEALWQLFFNGRKPVLRPVRYSVRQMRILPSAAARHKEVQEEITHETEQFLLSASGVTEKDMGKY